MFLIWENLGTCSLTESNTPEGWVIVDVRDISDVTKDIVKVKNRIMLIAGIMSFGTKVCIRCVAGINRSNAIAIGVMCYMQPMATINESWDIHFRAVRKMIKRIQIVPQLELTVKRALKETRRWKEKQN